jgi:arsenate reductase
MADRPLNLLFLCTHKSARSVLAEAIASRIDPARFRAYSAGSYPSGRVNPFAIDLLAKNHYPVEGLRSKSWDEFAAPGAPPLDFVFTVCDNAAGEVCPIWPGQPVTAHWGVPDPSAIEGSDEDKRRAFLDTYMRLKRRIELFASLPIGKLDKLALASRLREIGTT